MTVLDGIWAKRGQFIYYGLHTCVLLMKEERKKKEKRKKKKKKKKKKAENSKNKKKLEGPSFHCH